MAFKKGQSGNPGGRSNGRNRLTTAFWEDFAATEQEIATLQRCEPAGDGRAKPLSGPADFPRTLPDTLPLLGCDAWYRYSRRADTSTEPVRTGDRSERGRATARASSICAAP